MKMLNTEAMHRDAVNSRFVYKDPFYVNKVVLSGEGGSGIYNADGTTIVDEDGNIDAPVTSSNLTLSGTLTVAGASDVGTSCEANAYTVAGTAGADFSGAVTNLTVVKGIVTAAS